MNINLKFSATMLDNSAKFESAFFDRFQLTKRHQPLKLNDEVEKELLAWT